MTYTCNPDEVNYPHLLMTRAALKIEVNTTMRHSKGSVLKLAQNFGYTDAKRKSAALDDLNTLRNLIFDRQMNS